MIGTGSSPLETSKITMPYSGNFLRLGFAEKAGAWDFDEEIMVPFLLGLPTRATAPAPAGGLRIGIQLLHE